MRIRSLEILRLPGIRDPFAIKEMSPGLNLIIGPNASGKTSLCRAFRSLIWSDQKRMDHLSLSMQLVAGERELEVVREGDQTNWLADGAATERPVLPEAHLAKCFTVEVDDLNAAESGDEDLAQEILRHMAGGYDMRGLLTADKYRVKKTHGQEERATVEAARRELAKIRGEHLEISASEAGLERLEERKRLAGSARDELRQLELRLELVRARRDNLLAAEALALFEPQMRLLEGTEMSRIQDLRREIAEKTKAIAGRQDLIDLAHETIEQANLPEEGLDSLRFARHMAGIEELRACESELRNQEQLLEDAETQVARARERLGSRDLSTTCIDDSVLRRAEAYLKQVDVLIQQRANLESRLRLLVGDGSSAELVDLQQAVACLREWRSVPGPAQSYLRRLRGLAVALTLMGMSAAIVAAVYLHPAFWALAGGSLLIGSWLGCQRDGESAEARERAITDFRRGMVSPPLAWTKVKVDARIAELEKETASAAMQAERDAESRFLAMQLSELETAEADLASERSRMLSDTGLDLSVSDLGLVLLTRNLGDLQDAVLERDQLLRRCKELRAEHMATSAGLMGFLVEHGEPTEGTVSAINLHSERLRQRSTDCSTSRQQLRDASAEKMRLQKELDSLAAKESFIFTSLDMDSGDDQTIIACLGRLEDFRAAQAAGHQAALREKICHEKVHELGPLPSEEELLGEIEGLRSLAASFEQIVGEIAEIRQKIDSARHGRVLAEAIKVENEALAALEDRLEEASLASAGRFLLEEVEEQHAKEARPEILEQAADLFAEFTEHQFELQLSDGWGGQQARFVARDTKGDRLRSLAELSTGTRSQLLIAVRLAFAMQAERGEALPFFLDDVLSTSDPARFESIVKNLQAFAEKDGRQIIYLTSSPADLAAWSRDAEVHVVDLGELRALGQSVRDSDDLLVPELPEVILPRGLSPSEYATAIKVPPFRPLREASEVHLFYLLGHDLELLHRVLRERVEYLGPLRSMISGDRMPSDLTSEDRHAVEAMIDLTLCFSQAWRIGRGLPVDRRVLREAGVSERFLNDFAEIAEELGGSASRLIQVIEERQDLRVKGFRKDKMDSLRQALLASGHLDQRPQLSEDEIRAELLRALEPAIRGGSISNTAVIQRVHELVHHAQKN